MRREVVVLGGPVKINGRGWGGGGSRLQGDHVHGNMYHPNGYKHDEPT